MVEPAFTPNTAETAAFAQRAPIAAPIQTAPDTVAANTANQSPRTEAPQLSGEQARLFAEVFAVALRKAATDPTVTDYRKSFKVAQATAPNKHHIRLAEQRFNRALQQATRQELLKEMGQKRIDPNLTAPFLREIPKAIEPHVHAVAQQKIDGDDVNFVTRLLPQAMKAATTSDDFQNRVLALNIARASLNPTQIKKVQAKVTMGLMSTVEDNMRAQLKNSSVPKASQERYIKEAQKVAASHVAKIASDPLSPKDKTSLFVTPEEKAIGVVSAILSLKGNAHADVARPHLAELREVRSAGQDTTKQMKRVVDLVAPMATIIAKELSATSSFRHSDFSQSVQGHLRDVLENRFEQTSQPPETAPKTNTSETRRGFATAAKQMFVRAATVDILQPVRSWVKNMFNRPTPTPSA